LILKVNAIVQSKKNPEACLTLVLHPDFYCPPTLIFPPSTVQPKRLIQKLPVQFRLLNCQVIANANTTVNLRV
jgi:hypothetical protein